MSAAFAPQIRVVVDSDGGIDDQLAVAYLATDPSVDLVGVVATYGARPAEVAARNLILLLEDVGRSDIPVCLGAAHAAGPSPEMRLATWLHGPEGLGDLPPRPPETSIDGRAPEELLRNVSDCGPFALLTLGPLSTMARCLAHVTNAERLVVMGGALNRAGTVLPAAEANIARDPWSSSAVMSAAWDHVPNLVTLDVSMTTTATHSLLETLGGSRKPLGQRLSAMARYYFTGNGGPSECPVHDFVAAIALVRPELFTWQELYVAVDVGGSHAWGATVASVEQPRSNGWGRWRVARDAAVDAVRAEMLRTALQW